MTFIKGLITHSTNNTLLGSFDLRTKGHTNVSKTDPATTITCGKQVAIERVILNVGKLAIILYCGLGSSHTILLSAIMHQNSAIIAIFTYQ